MSATDRLEIAAVDARDFMRLTDVHIDATAERHLLLIAGKNKAGKSSLMKAIESALGGKEEIPAMPVRTGAEDAEITVTLRGKNGTYKVTKTIAPDRDQRLKIVGPNGASVSKPQAWLDDLIAGNFLDPSEFLTLAAAEQSKVLLEVVGVDVATLNADKERAYNQRRDEKRAHKAAVARREGIPDLPPKPADARDVDVIQAELDQVEAARRAGEDAARRAETFAGELARHEEDQSRRRARLEELRREVAKLEGELAEGEKRTVAGKAAVAEARATVPAADVVAGLAARQAELRAEASRSSAAVAWRARAEERQRQIAEADAEIQRRAAAETALNEEIEAIEAHKATLLSSADMPVPGLAVTDDGLMLNGAPFSQASQAEQIRCAMAIAMRRSPNLRDVWIRLGALLDEDGLELVRKMAEELDCRVWLEVVGERIGAGVIVIREGRVLGGRKG
jgi:DNA repair exonuclease SbcCD ATPase subunit